MSAIGWLRWAVIALGAIGAFIITTLYAQLSESTASIGRVEANVTRSIDNLSSTMTNTNSVLQATAVRLEGVARLVEVNTQVIDRHEDLLGDMRSR